MTRERRNLIRSLEILKSTVDNALDGARQDLGLNAHNTASAVATNVGNVLFALGECAQAEFASRRQRGEP